MDKIQKWLDRALPVEGKNGPGRKKSGKERYESRYKTIGKNKKRNK